MNIVIVGASSGIGRELALLYGADPGNRLGLLARRKTELEKIAHQSKAAAEIMQFDLEQPDCGRQFKDFINRFARIDLIIYCAGYGEINPQLDWGLCRKTLTVNVLSFTEIINTAYLYFKNQGNGRIAAIASIGGLRGAENDSGYSASKSYMIKYLEGMSRKSRKDGSGISISTILPGFVDTAMAKGEGIFWMTSPQVAARQITAGLERKRRNIYVTRRWRLIAWLLWIMPDWIYERI